MKNRLFLIIFFTGLVLNISGYFIADFSKIYYKHPLFLDSTGSIFAGVILGPLMGAVTGFTSNLILGVIHNPVNIPFSIVNAIIGFTAGLIAVRCGFAGAKSILSSIILISVITSLAGAVVAFFVFGGVTGAKLDLNIITIMNAGYKLFTSSFIVRVPVNLVDKSISVVIVFFLVRQLKPENRGYAAKIL
jgi:energy-coupling factor transport system substrate-specific component